MRRLWKFLGVGVVVFALVGCATVGRPTRTSPENGAIFGYFKIPRIFGYLDYLSILRSSPGTRFYVGIPSDVHYVIRGGAFFAYDAKPGQYQVASLYTVGGGYFNGERKKFNLTGDMYGTRSYNERLMEESFFTVKPGQLHYVGARNVYVGRRQGLPTDGTFSVGPTDTPTEKQVLEELLPVLKGTPWQDPAEALLASLP